MSEAEAPTLLEEDASIPDLIPQEAGIEGDVFTETESLESDAGQESDQPTVELSTIAQLMGLTDDDLDLDDDGIVVFKSKIDGQESRAKALDVKASYQKQGHLDNELRTVKQQKESLKTQQDQFKVEQSQRVQQFEDINRVAYMKLQNDASKINWEQLREEDPGEFAAKQAEFQKAEGEIRQALGQVATHRQTEKQQNEVAEREKLPDLIPEWNDSAVAEKERAEISTYMTTKSINPEIAGFADGIALLRKARLYDALIESKPEITKLVKKAPKVSKPGAKAPTKQAEKSIEDVFYG